MAKDLLTHPGPIETHNLGSEEEESQVKILNV